MKGLLDISDAEARRWLDAADRVADVSDEVKFAAILAVLTRRRTRVYLALSALSVVLWLAPVGVLIAMEG
jgi:hypothetical protein